jgi:DNA-binding response OmpR family regulator
MSTVSAAVPNVVVVDPRFDAYKQLADSARLGRINLHIRSSGAEAMKIARRRTVDAWLIAADLDDMSGHDLVELLRERAAEAKVAMVEADGVGGRHHAVAEQEAVAAGADALLSQPITLRDLEEFLGLPVEERSKVFTTSGVARAFVTLPVGVGAAAVSIAILLFQ